MSTYTEGDPEKFTVGVLDSPLRIALPFQVSCFVMLSVITNACKAVCENCFVHRNRS